MRVLMIDNYDSFTYNLVQYLQELGAEVLVHRNDQISLEEIEALNPDRLMISPGPCTPNEAGISIAAIKHFAGKLPILGVRARQVMHGKTSPSYHSGQGVFPDLPSPYTATRYHSLVVEKDSLPDCLEMTAWTLKDDGSVDEVMGMRHKTLPIEGVQYHPESILSEHGHALLENFLKHDEQGDAA